MSGAPVLTGTRGRGEATLARHALVVGVGALAVAAAATGASGLSPLTLSLMTQAVITAILATAVGFLLRQNGLVSFGHAAFFGLAGYCFALWTKLVPLPVELGLLAALVLPAVLAFLFGLVIVRTSGIAFSMLTLAVGQAFYELFLKWRSVTNGDDGLSLSLPPRLFGLPSSIVQDPRSMFDISVAALVIVLILLWAFSVSHWGRLSEAIRENELRARYIGYSTVVVRAAVYGLSALIAALAGALLVLYNGYVSPDSLHWSLSGYALIMVVIGGARILWGPALGGVIYFFIKDFAGDLTEHWQALIGSILIIMTVTMPRGLGHYIEALARRAGGAGGGGGR